MLAPSKQCCPTSPLGCMPWAHPGAPSGACPSPALCPTPTPPCIQGCGRVGGTRGLHYHMHMPPPCPPRGGWLKGEGGGKGEKEGGGCWGEGGWSMGWREAGNGEPSHPPHSHTPMCPLLWQWQGGGGQPTPLLGPSAPPRGGGNGHGGACGGPRGQGLQGSTPPCPALPLLGWAPSQPHQFSRGFGIVP